MLENMLIQTIKKVVFAKKMPIGTRIPCYKKCVTSGFAGTVTRPVFLCLQIKQHDLDFPTRENGKTIVLFFFSFVMDCIVVVKLPLSCL